MRIGLLLTAMVFILSSAFGPAPRASAGVREELEKKLKELEQIERRQTELQNQLNRNASNRKKVQAELARIETDLAKLKKEMSYLQSRLKATEKQVAQVEGELDKLQDRLGKRMDLINARLQAMAEDGPVAYLEVLLQARNFTDFIERVDLLGEIVRRDSEIYQEVVSIKAQVEERKADLEQRKEQIAELQEKTQAKKSQIEVKAAERSRVLANLQTEKERLEREEDELEKISDRIAKEIAEYQKKLGIKQVYNKFDYPISPPIRITSSFGMRLHPILKKKKMHNGVDFGKPAGSPMKASENGVVMFAGPLPTKTTGYGLTVIIDHGGGVTTLYAHNQSIRVKVGDRVEKGDVIAYVGSTGYSTGPHAHFEIRINGQPVDPMKYLK